MPTLFSSSVPFGSVVDSYIPCNSFCLFIPHCSPICLLCFQIRRLVGRAHIGLQFSQHVYDILKVLEPAVSTRAGNDYIWSVFFLYALKFLLYTFCVKISWAPLPLSSPVHATVYLCNHECSKKNQLSECMTEEHIPLDQHCHEVR